MVMFVFTIAGRYSVYANPPSLWAQEAVDNAIAAGLVPANLQSNYSRNITRAEFASLAVAVYESRRGTIYGRVNFADTNDVDVRKAAYVGVVNGVDDTRFDPNGILTREQAAVMLVRLANAIGYPLTGRGTPFADNSSISGWARDSVENVHAAGIMHGIGNNRFDPQGTFTREQSIATIWRLYERIPGASLGNTLQPVAPSVPSISADERRVFELVNLERANYGLPPLIWHNELADVARAHSVDMAERRFFNHVCPYGRSLANRVDNAGIRWGTMLAENIASGQTTPEQVVRAWMESPGHRANVLNNQAVYLGVGRYNNLWTKKFMGA